MLPGMNQTRIAAGSDFCTIDWAAELAGCSRRTITRAIARGQLNATIPMVGRHESLRAKQLLFADQVREWAAAYKTVKGGRRG